MENELMDRAALEAMPRRRLQLLAKKAGIRANQKSAVLLELLLEHQQRHDTDHVLKQQQPQEEEEEEGKPEQPNAQEPAERDGGEAAEEPQQEEQEEHSAAAAEELQKREQEEHAAADAASEEPQQREQEADDTPAAAPAEEGVKEDPQEAAEETAPVSAVAPALTEAQNDDAVEAKENESTQNPIRQEIVNELSSRLQQARPTSTTTGGAVVDTTKTLSKNGQKNRTGNVVSKNIEQYAEEKAKRHLKLSSTPRLKTTTHSQKETLAKTPLRQKAFDLKQSLSRGVSWKMKKGPLPTFSAPDAATSSLSMFSPKRQEQRAKLFNQDRISSGTEKRRFNLLATGRAKAQQHINEHRMRVPKEAAAAPDTKKTS